MKESWKRRSLYFAKVSQAWPNSLVANVAAGSVLDLMGREARRPATISRRAIDAADTPEHKAQAQRQMAMSGTLSTGIARRQ